MKFKFSILILLLSIVTANAQDYSNLIIGKWDGLKKETKAGRDTLNNGQKMIELSKYEFYADGQVMDTFNRGLPEYYPYSISGNTLNIGRALFKIEKLTSKELIILEYKKEDPQGYLAFRHYFIKTNKFIYNPKIYKRKDK